MEAQPTEGGIEPLRSVCPECRTDNPRGARYCKHCGAAISPPSECPKCDTELPPDARFCPSCGAKLVGPRPKTEPDSTPVVEEAENATQAAKAEIERQASALPPSPRTGSNLGGNVLLFVAILALLLVAIYVMNRGAAKEHNPFEGGPPPAAAVTPPATPPSAEGASAAAAPAGGDPITGVITVPEQFAKTAAGTIFVVVRMAGSPNRGPPLAVRRIQGPSFPQGFKVGPSDVMLPNMPFTGPFDIYVRLDRDGNAMTKDPGDLASSTPLTNVRPGATDLAVVLDKQL